MSEQPITAPKPEPLWADDPANAVRIDLGQGEEVILVIRPHWLYVLLDRMGLVVLLLLANVAVWFVTGDWGVRLAGAVLLVGWVLWQFAERASRRYVLTTRRVVAVAGLLRQRVVDAPIKTSARSQCINRSRSGCSGWARSGLPRRARGSRM